VCIGKNYEDHAGKWERGARIADRLQQIQFGMIGLLRKLLAPISLRSGILKRIGGGIGKLGDLS
jgi:hypothetical protein